MTPNPHSSGTASTRNTLRHFSRPAADRTTAGFTLLEMLLALGLAGLLMVAISGAITLYARAQTAGREQAQQAQLVRTLLRQIELDLRSVTFTPPEPEATEAEGQVAEGAAEELDAAGEEQSFSIQQPTDALQSASDGLVGDATQIVLHLSRPPRVDEITAPATSDTAGFTTGTAATASGAATGSDLRSVAWFLATAGAGGLAGAVAEQAQAEPGPASFSSATSGGTGLARLNGDRLAMQSADATGNLSLLAGQTRVLAPEVNLLGFRYFDGVDWLDTWNSVEQGRLPLAVEITLGLDMDAARTGDSGFSPEPATRATINSTVSPPEQQTWRLIVPLPQAESPLIEEGF